MMRNIAIIGCLICSITLSAQTKVTKRIATKSNNYGVTYFLPKTTFIVEAEVAKTVRHAGQYYMYAEKHLGATPQITEDNTSYELKKVTLTNKGVPDSDQSFTVEFKAGTAAPFVYLTEDGLICTINADYTAPKPATTTSEQTKPRATTSSANVLSEELLMAGSTARQAEVAAKQIYRIRESRMNILTGDADNMPPDGEAMKLVIQQLEDQEKALMNLFYGTETTETSTCELTVVPVDDVEKDVLFRFSTKLGVLEADDLGGDPVYMDMQVTERAPVLDAKEAQKKEKNMKGIIYNLPGKAAINIYLGTRTLYQGEQQVTQFGTQESLAQTMLDDKKSASPVKVYFYPETGAIRQIIQ